VLTILLSAFLVVNTVSALMAQQIRYIGVMKAVGGRTGQIVGMYLVACCSAWVRWRSSSPRPWPSKLAT
jgi:cell division protein FtsX